MIDVPMADGWTPFLYAAVNGYPSIVDLLGAPLLLDSSRRKQDSVILSNVNATDRFKRNALHWLIRQICMSSGKHSTDLDDMGSGRASGGVH